jgi:TolB-like protein/Tfp pilus assembly protein PilF
VPDVFLSYNREDMAVARHFADGFIAEGFDVWWDQTLRAGQTYDEVTENALRTAKAVVVLWSPRSTASRWVRVEATLADRAKTLLPVMIEPCERPIMFELTQTVDLCGWQGDRSAPGWHALVHDVRAFVARAGGFAPPPPPPPAPAIPLPATSPVEPAPSRRGKAPSLAVMPFANRSGMPEDEAFAFGMVEDVIDALSEGVHVRVIASSATARFRSAPVLDLEEMGRQLGVRYVLEGNVRRTGENLRVTAQLVETSSGEIVWNQKFERAIAELAALQEELVREVAAHLGARIYKLEMERALRKPSDLTAWECVTRAIAVLRTMTGDALQTAIEEAQRAIAIAPDYGLAYAVLAQTVSGAYSVAELHNPERIAEIQGLINKALSLDHDNTNVLASVAGALFFIERPEESLMHAERAIRQRPGNGIAHLYAGMAATLLDRHDEAFAHYDTFLRIEPDSHVHYATYGFRAVCFARAGDFAAARADLNHSFDLFFHNYAGRTTLAMIEMLEGNEAAARQHMVIAREAEPWASKELYRQRLHRYFMNNPLEERLAETLDELWVDA